MRLVRKTFGNVAGHIEDPEWVTFCGWRAGVHMFTKCTASAPTDEEYSTSIAHPDPQLPFFVANEAFSLNYQQWVEGSLQTAEHAANATLRCLVGVSMAEPS
jgi:hypothetical protein